MSQTNTDFYMYMTRQNDGYYKVNSRTINLDFILNNYTITMASSTSTNFLSKQLNFTITNNVVTFENESSLTDSGTYYLFVLYPAYANYKMLSASYTVANTKTSILSNIGTADLSNLIVLWTSNHLDFVPFPSGGGTSYTAGNALNINNNTIGVVTDSSSANFNGVVVTNTPETPSPIISLDVPAEQVSAYSEHFYIELTTTNDDYTGQYTGIISKYLSTPDSGYVGDYLIDSTPNDGLGSVYSYTLTNGTSYNTEWSINLKSSVLTAERMNSLYGIDVTTQCLDVFVKTFVNS